MNWTLFLLAGVIGYLLGSISFARIFIRAAGHDSLSPVDLRSPDGEVRMTSDAVSATAVRLQAGPKWGVTTAVADILKAFIPTLAFRLMFPGEPYLYAVGLMAIVGHNWPVYYRFKGGRGQSPMLGAMLAIAPVGALVCTTVGFLVGYFVLREPMIADNLGQLLFIGWAWAAGLGPWGITWAVAANTVFFGSYTGEIRQYVAARKSGHLRDPDEVMQMMQMDYDWITSKKTEKPPSTDEKLL
ncbi:MAG TPA: glycerol-3-phosphate acyltransferase [Coriobacteriia bacterium]|nr:glycerol-3-phosphate acyltransferase [Coriobacteriia bacterium]